MDSRRVLIVDDTALYRGFLKDILAKGGYEVVGEAGDGVEGLRLAQELQPDFILLDIVMPLKNGLEVARELATLDLPSKVVMCTTLGHNAVVLEAMQSGVSGFITKPFNEFDVLTALDELLS